MCTTCAWCMESEEGFRSPGTELMKGYEQHGCEPCWCWESNLGPLEELSFL